MVLVNAFRIQIPVLEKLLRYIYCINMLSSVSIFTSYIANEIKVILNFKLIFFCPIFL